MLGEGLTCPQCCCNTLNEKKKSIWECERCGASYDLAKMRQTLDDLIGCEFSDDFISELLQDAKLSPCIKLGERGWKMSGRYGTLYLWDVGNGWYSVVRAKAKRS